MLSKRAMVDRIVYTNAESGFTVLRMTDEDTEEAFTAVGVLANPIAGAGYRLEGNYEESRYGRQFKIQTAIEEMPATLKGLEKYLGSGMIQGVGKVFAGKIVESYGMDTISIIEDDPQRLLEIEGIGKKKLEKITKAWNSQKEIKNVMIFLQGYGLSPAYAIKIYKAYGDHSIRKVKDNPYALIRDIWGIGFKLADKLARNMGIQADDSARIQAGIGFVLEDMSKQGHCYADFDNLRIGAARLLEVGEERVEGEIRQLARLGLIIEGAPDLFFLPSLHEAEVSIKDCLEAILAAQPKRKTMDESAVVDEISRTAGIIYDDTQQSAIRMSLSARVMVLTGGPGTGKTTTVMGILRALAMQERKVLLAAPTGRAAKRLAETTQREAKTIHRLLEFSPAEGFMKNQGDPLECDTLILDEASMIDVILMDQVLRALSPKSSLILVGDVDQLPAVGPGDVLRDFIDSDVLDVIRLSRIFRQGKSSRIVDNAHRINQGQMIETDHDKEADFFFMEKKSDKDLVETIASLVSKRLPASYDLDPLRDIQVLSPMQKGEVGAKNLNIQLQKVLNPQKEKIIFGQTEFRLHDRVMQIRNNYDKKVFNGDIGLITAIDTDTKQMLINFSGDQLVYDVGDLDELVLAYAVTIHKSQGSEYPVVITPLTMSHYVMLRRKLIYTAVTRASKLMILIGEKRALKKAIQDQDGRKRNTRLKERLREMLA